MDTYNSFRMITYKQFTPKLLILNKRDFAFSPLNHRPPYAIRNPLEHYGRAIGVRPIRGIDWQSFPIYRKDLSCK
jgi:hypothetical protein